MELIIIIIIVSLTVLAVYSMQVYYPELITSQTTATMPPQAGTSSVYEGTVPFTPNSMTDTFSLQDGRIFTPQQKVVITGIIFYYDHGINDNVAYTANLWSSTTETLMETITIPASSSTTSAWIVYPLSHNRILNSGENYYITLGYALNSPRTVFNTATPFLPYTNNGVTIGYRIASSTTGFPNLLANSTYQTHNILAIDMQFYLA